MVYQQRFLGRWITRSTQVRLARIPLYLCLILFLSAPFAIAQSSFSYVNAYDFATPTAWSYFVSTKGCPTPDCSYLPLQGSGTGQVNSSDYYVAQAIYMQNLADGEVVTWKFTTPTGSVQPFLTVTYNLASDCFVVMPGGYEYCGDHDALGLVVAGPVNSCTQTYTLMEVGPWSISSYDGNTLLYSNSFQISRNPNGMLGITSPTDNQLFQLLQGNYNATGNVTFSAGTNTGKPISWTSNLHYQSSGGYPMPATDPTPLTFQGTTYAYSGYQAIGGQVKTTAQITALDGSTVTDCVTSYVEGPATGIPNTTITARLDQLYPASASYAQYLNDGTETPNLFTGVAEHESSYQQFQTPAEANPNSDLFGLYANFGIPAKWPKENLKTNTIPRGEFIGLLQVMTTDPDAWDWTANTQDGINLFSGGSSTDKVQTSVRFEGYIINGYTNGKTKISLPAHINGNGSYLSSLTGVERENNALVLYSGNLSCKSGDYGCVVISLYYIPQCPSPGVQTTNKQGNLVCQGGTWQWVTNNANQSGGIGYVSQVRSGLN